MDSHARVVKMLGHDSTTGSAELMRVGRQVIGPAFVGVFAADMVPQVSNHPSYMVINLDSSDNPRGGSHWVGRYTSGNGTSPMFYDSYARRVAQYLPEQQGVDTDISNSPLDQAETGPGSESCGQRTIAALMVARTGGRDAFGEM